MVFQKAFLATLNNDFNTAVRMGSKDKAVAVFSALVGIAISVTPAQPNTLYKMLTKATDMPFSQLSKDKEALITLIAQNI